MGASYYGLPGEQKDMFADFVKKKYWRTDHDLDSGEGLRLYNLLTEVQVNDRFCIRYFDKKGRKIHIANIGTVTDVSKIGDGRLGSIGIIIHQNLKAISLQEQVLEIGGKHFSN